MSVFLKDFDKIYLYEELLYYINNSSFYKPYCQTIDLYEFFTNLLLGLVSNSPLVLLDADLNPLELAELKVEEVNKEKFIVKKQFATLIDLVTAVKTSFSEIIIFTSGTTGQPKQVRHTIQTLTRSVRIGEFYQGQVWGFAYNPTHMAGLQVFFQAFENLNTLVNLFNCSRLEINDLLKSEGITHLSATPTFYRLLLPIEKVFENVQRVTLGGEKSDQKLYGFIKRLFPYAKINNVYASTEAGSLLASKGEYFQIPESLSDKFRVENEELLIHKSLLGKSESVQYYGDYYRTGDLIEWMDEKKGIFRFKSRKNELINIGGYKINPAEVEDVLLQMEGMQQAVVYGKPNSVLGHILCAELKVLPGVILTELQVRRYLQDKLQDFKIPRRIKFVEQFLLTRTGKIKR
jgi:acyl-coenzyme A synthetase/AMP-(fatty) acid ligase